MQIKLQNNQEALQSKHDFFFNWFDLFFNGKINDKKRITFKEKAFLEAFPELSIEQANARFSYAKNKKRLLKDLEYLILFQHAKKEDSTIEIEKFFPKYRTEIELKTQLAEKQEELEKLQQKLEIIKSI